MVGVGEGEHFVASAIPAFLRETRNVQLVGDDEIVTVRAGSAPSSAARPATPVEREIEEITWDEDAAEKAGYPTFMLKEIHEQSDAIAETIADRLTHDDRVELSDIGISDDELAKVRRIVIVACGTSYHAGLVGRYAIEQWARVPVEMDIASEYRYRNPVVGPDDLVIGISQSGETADTLAAMRLARSRGAHVLAITNILGSQATRDADGVLYTRAGLEIGVAATKTFVAQVAAMYLLGLKLAELRHTMEPAELRGPDRRAEGDPAPDRQARHVMRASRCGRSRAATSSVTSSSTSGRHIGLPVCLEGALKLKEISYIPTDAYAAGEMKHGPIALLDSSTPVVCVATDSPVLDKVLSNIAEVKARGAEVIAVATEGSGHVAAAADQTVFIPRTDWILQPILAVIPLQLLAYHIARLRGLNVDQPRNLAKTVTVESDDYVGNTLPSKLAAGGRALEARLGHDHQRTALLARRCFRFQSGDREFEAVRKLTRQGGGSPLREVRQHKQELRQSRCWALDAQGLQARRTRCRRLAAGPAVTAIRSPMLEVAPLELWV